MPLGPAEGHCSSAILAGALLEAAQGTMPRSLLCVQLRLTPQLTLTPAILSLFACAFITKRRLEATGFYVWQTWLDFCKVTLGQTPYLLETHS